MHTHRILTLCLGGLLVVGSSAFASDFVAAPLSGAEEVPARETNARGNATFEVSADGSQITYKLIVANIDNVTMAHIHLGAAGATGGIVAFLFGAVPAGGGASNGVLATGTLTSANLTGALVGRPLSALIEEMQAGNTYVNVHTDDGVAPTNTGPGDFPGGEIRSQIRAAD